MRRTFQQYIMINELFRSISFQYGEKKYENELHEQNEIYVFTDLNANELHIIYCIKCYLDAVPAI